MVELDCCFFLSHDCFRNDCSTISFHWHYYFFHMGVAHYMIWIIFDFIQLQPYTSTLQHTTIDLILHIWMIFDFFILVGCHHNIFVTTIFRRIHANLNSSFKFILILSCFFFLFSLPPCDDVVLLHSDNTPSIDETFALFCLLNTTEYLFSTFFSW